jgi:hypothetical protein
VPFDHPLSCLRRYAAASSTLPCWLADSVHRSQQLRERAFLAPHSEGRGGNSIWPIPGYFNFGEFSGAVFKCRTKGSLCCAPV